MKLSEKKDRGFVGIIVLIIIALVALKYFFDFSIFEFLGSEEGQSALDYTKDILAWLKSVVLAAWAYIH